MESQDYNKKCNIIIISGFLGSGKTTLIDGVLKAKELHKKVAVI
jgi:G3E family GTPase